MSRDDDGSGSSVQGRRQRPRQQEAGGEKVSTLCGIMHTAVRIIYDVFRTNYFEICFDVPKVCRSTTVIKTATVCCFHTAVPSTMLNTELLESCSPPAGLVSQVINQQRYVADMAPTMTNTEQLESMPAPNSLMSQGLQEE